MKNLMINSAITLSSLDIAELTGKDHDNVLRDIRKTLSQVEIDAVKFEGIYKDSINRDKPCYNLPRRECDLVVSGYVAKYRLAIIDRWHELESQQPSLPKTLPEALRAYALELEEHERTKELLDDTQYQLEEKTCQLDESHEWVSIKRMATVNGKSWRDYSWRKLKGQGIKQGLSPRKIFDANYGEVNAYHIDTWGKCYPDDSLPED